MLFQEVFSGVTNPIIQKLQNKLHRQRPAVSKQQAVDGAPLLRGRGALPWLRVQSFSSSG